MNIKKGVELRADLSEIMTYLYKHEASVLNDFVEFKGTANVAITNILFDSRFILIFVDYDSYLDDCVKLPILDVLDWIESC